jgi:hypothetical protein
VGRRIHCRASFPRRSVDRLAVKIRAKAKVARERRLAQKELEENLTPLEVIEGESKRIGRVKTINTGELKNVIAQTVQRVYSDHFGTQVDYTNAREYHADLIVKAMKYGYFDPDGYLRLAGGIPMRDHSYASPPLCEKHEPR